MKKQLFMAAVAALCLASCTTSYKTSRTENIPVSVYNATVSDLDVSPERVVYTMKPSKDIRRAGVTNCKSAAVQECLSKYGNADVLLEPRYVVSIKKTSLFSKVGKVTSVTVSGRPAKYKNFRSAPDAMLPQLVGKKEIVNITNGKPASGL